MVLFGFDQSSATDFMGRGVRVVFSACPAFITESRNVLDLGTGTDPSLPRFCSLLSVLPLVSLPLATCAAISSASPLRGFESALFC